MRDIRTLNQSAGQQIESDEVMTRIGELEARNLGVIGKMSVLNKGKVLIPEGLRVEPSLNMTVNVVSGGMFQRDDLGNIYVGMQVEDQTITMSAASGSPRIDIVEAQIKTVTDKTDYARIGSIATGAGGGSVIITNEEIKRDLKTYIAIQKQTGTTTATPATAGILTGTVSIPTTIDLSTLYLVNISDGEDGDFQEVDCRGATPSATTKAEIVSAFNAAVGRTIASLSGNYIVLTGAGTGLTSIFTIKPPVSDSGKDALEEIFGVAAGGSYRYEYQGANPWIKLCEIDIGAASTEITTGMIRNVDQKSTWASDSADTYIRPPLTDIYNDQATGYIGLGGNLAPAYALDVTGSIRASSIVYTDTILEKTASNGVLVDTLKLKDNHLYLNTASGGNGYISSTEHATKGKIYFGSAGNSVYDEVNDRFGIGRIPTSVKLEVQDNIKLSANSGVTRWIQIGADRGGDGTSHLDLISDTTNSYGLRLIRNTGVNGTAQLQTYGTGTLTIRTLEAADIGFQTNSTVRLTISSAGVVNVGVNGEFHHNGTQIIDSSGNITTTKTIEGSQLSSVNATDPKLIFDTGTTDFHIGIDSTDSKLYIGLDATPGTNPIIDMYSGVVNLASGVVMKHNNTTVLDAGRNLINILGISNTSGTFGINAGTTMSIDAGTSVHLYKIAGGGSIWVDATGVKMDTLPTSGTGNPVYIDGSGYLWENTSSLQYKEKIKKIEIDTEKIYQLNPISFNYKKQKNRKFGLIAEEVYEIIPELVSLDNKGKPKGIDYMMLSVLLLNEIKKIKNQLSQ